MLETNKPVLGQPNNPKSHRTTRGRALTAIFLLLLGYPAFEFFVWTPAVMSIYCPKVSSITGSTDWYLNRFKSGSTLLMLDELNREPMPGLRYVIGELGDHLRRVAVPISKVSPEGLRNYFLASSRDATFVTFATSRRDDQACTLSDETVLGILAVISPEERRGIEEDLRALESQGLCLSISLSRTIEADYVQLTIDSRTATSAGLLAKRESTVIPTRNDLGGIVRFERGELHPTLPVTRFVVRHGATGYLPCQP